MINNFSSQLKCITLKIENYNCKLISQTELHIQVHHEELPSIRIFPSLQTEKDKETERRRSDPDRTIFVYECPVYRTESRKGEVDQSTGKSKNFIFCLEMTSEKPSDHWIDRGVASIAQINS